MEGYLCLTLESIQRSHACPTCNYRSSRPHSPYTSLIQDLPLSDQPTKSLPLSRKWFYDSLTCKVKVFTERYNFAFRKGRTYGSLICYLQSHMLLALLPNRDSEQVTQWLKTYPHIEIFSRDGFIGFLQAIAISDANSSILQIYDRWHFI